MEENLIKAGKIHTPGDKKNPDDDIVAMVIFRQSAHYWH